MRLLLLALFSVCASASFADNITATLKTATTSSDPHVRAAAARALADGGDKSATNQLIVLLNDPDPAVATAAADAIGKLGDKSVTGLFIAMLTADHTGDAGGPVFGGDTAAVAGLREQRIASALQALGRLGDSTAVPAILDNGLGAPQISVRIAAAVALGRIKDRRATGPLVALLQQRYEVQQGPVIDSPGPQAAQRMKENIAYLCASAAWALGQIGDEQARTILVRAADDDNSLVRDAAKEALKKISERAPN